MGVGMNNSAYLSRFKVANHSILPLFNRWCLFFALSCLFLSTVAANEPVDAAPLDYKRAEKLYYAYQNDSLLLVVDQELNRLAAAGTLNSPLALRFRLLKEKTLERRQNYGDVLGALYEIVDDCQTYNVPDVELETHLVLALIHEKLDKGTACRKDLDAALLLAKKHQLDSLYPHVALRRSSYHSFYGTIDSAFYYAHRAYQNGKEVGHVQAQVDGHMLLGILYSSDDLAKSFYHFREMGKLFLAQENYDGYSIQFSNMASLHLKYGFPEKALDNSDSTIHYLLLAEKRGLDDPSKIAYAYSKRAQILRVLGQQDSAWHYLNISHKLQLEASYRKSSNKVAEIEAKYASEKKEQQLTEQSRLLKEQKQAQQRLIGVILLVLLFASILAYYYVRLHRANAKLEDQSKQIAKNNVDLEQSLSLQIMLQGEIHHRVKNNLQVIISLLELQAEELQDPIARSRLASMSGRIYSMAAIHEILHTGKEGDSLVNLPNYIHKICDHFQRSLSSVKQAEIQLDLQEVDFNLETLMPLGIVLNELLTNSLKYGSQSNRRLQINIGFYAENDCFIFNYRDNGPGYTKGSFTKREGSLGYYLLSSMARQLQGKMITGNDAGAFFQLYFGDNYEKILEIPEPFALEAV